MSTANRKSVHAHGKYAITPLGCRGVKDRTAVGSKTGLPWGQRPGCRGVKGWAAFGSKAKLTLGVKAGLPLG